MGYRDDFYKKDNIIGYTGEIGKQPTIYFADAGGTEPRTVVIGGKTKVLVSFGHITQNHSMSDNIGRENVLESHSYSIYNNAQGAAEECVHGPTECERLFGRGGREEMEAYGDEGLTPDGHYIFHPSRNKFIPVNKGTVNLLAGAIEKFPDLKSRYK